MSDVEITRLHLKSIKYTLWEIRAPYEAREIIKGAVSPKDREWYPPHRCWHVYGEYAVRYICDALERAGHNVVWKERQE